MNHRWPASAEHRSATSISKHADIRSRTSPSARQPSCGWRMPSGARHSRFPCAFLATANSPGLHCAPSGLRFGNPAARQPGNPAIRHPGTPAPRRKRAFRPVVHDPRGRGSCTAPWSLLSGSAPSLLPDRTAPRRTRPVPSTHASRRARCTGNPAGCWRRLRQSNAPPRCS